MVRILKNRQEIICITFQYKDLGRHKEAISTYEDAIALKRDHTSAWNNYGLLYEELGEFNSHVVVVFLEVHYRNLHMQKCTIKQKS